MKQKIFIGICMIILFSQICFSLEFGYPFDGRIVNSDDQGIENIKLKFIFYGGDFLCESVELSTIYTGDFYLTLNDNMEILNSNTGKSCIAKIIPGMKTAVMLNKSLIGCKEEIIYYGNFTVGNSDTSVGTYRITNCTVEEHSTYKSPSGGGGGGRGSSGKNEKEHIIIMTPEEVDKFLKELEEKNKVIPDESEIKEDVEEDIKPLIQMPSIKIQWDSISIDPFLFFRLSLVLVLIANLLILTTFLRKEVNKTSKRKKKK